MAETNVDLGAQGDLSNETGYCVGRSNASCQDPEDRAHQAKESNGIQA